jgi:predicted RNase H-like nuclease (RuvC/YqgF family)
MHRTSLRSLAIALAIIATMISSAYGQSLGDVARENRQKKGDNTSAAQPNVITNQDLPKDPAADQAAPEVQPTIGPPANKSSEQSAADRRTEQRFAQQRLAEQRAAEQWKRRILTQKDKILTLQTRIAHLKATLQFADVSTYPYAGPYNRDQARQLQRITQLQEELDEQQRKLDQMQDAARHAGMHTAVYDP